MGRKAKVTIEKNRCKGCELCVTYCPKQVLAMSKEINDKGYFYAQVVNQDACIACRFCGMMCPDTAIEIAVEESEKSEVKADG
ncbi:MAG: 4Fe-4S dicluster domain-containing protein [candidate division WOR-3 bacterium]